MPERALPCIVCGKDLANVFPSEVENQPNDGVVATIRGNYGSTAFDPFDGTFLEVNVCDPCLVEAGAKGRVLTARHATPVEFEDVGVVGWAVIPEPVYVPWTEGLPGDDSKLYIYEEELDSPPKGIQLHITPEQIRKAQKGLES